MMGFGGYDKGCQAASTARRGLDQKCRGRRVHPDAAFYDVDFGEFLLVYDDVRKTPSPMARSLKFCQSTYDAAATLANWDRSAEVAAHC